jgi:hypothetical protein
MPSAATRHWAGRFLVLVGLCTLLAGCATTFRSESDLAWWARLGFRPDEPSPASATSSPKDEEICKDLDKFVWYARDLKEAYRSRATQNRSWIYVAGITGLGVAAASGALAAASAVAAGTLALLAISGGFTAAAFATIDNSELANVYTVAANDIGTALANVEAWSSRCPSDNCAARLAYLTTTLSKARNMLETARTSSAAGALARASAQKTMLDREIARVEAETKARDAKLKADATATKSPQDRADATVKADAAAEARKEAAKAAEAVQAPADAVPPCATDSN